MSNFSSSLCPHLPTNFTPVPERHLTKYITKYFDHIAPFWFVIGFPGAILSFIIWTRKPMRQSSSIYLAALALYDSLFFLHHMIFYIYNQKYAPLLDVPFYCELFPPIYYFLQYMSPILTLGFTVERFISICFPFRRDQLCSKSRAWKITLILSVIGIAMGSVQGLIVTYKTDTKMCDYRQCIMEETWQRKFYLVWVIFSEMLIFGIVPIAILVFNVLVIHEMHKMAKRQQPSTPLALPLHNTNNQKKITNGKQPTAPQGRSGAAATTAMLLTLSFYVLAACLPITILQIVANVVTCNKCNPCLSDAEAWADPGWREYFIADIVRKITFFIGESHYAVKFYIYVATGKMFRQQLVELFRICFSCITFCKRNENKNNHRTNARNNFPSQKRRPNRYSQGQKKEETTSDCIPLATIE